MKIESRHLPKLTFVFSLLGASLLWLLTLWQSDHEFSNLLKIFVWAFIVLCWLTVMLMIFPIVRNSFKNQMFNRKFFIQEKKLANKLLKLFEDNSELFENRRSSFSNLINELYNSTAQNPDLNKRLLLVVRQLHFINGWQKVLKKLISMDIEKTGKMSLGVKLQDTLMFYIALETTIRDFNSIDLESENLSGIEGETKEIAFDRFNSCIRNYEDFLKEVKKTYGHTDEHRFVRLGRR